jgi:hypothetical protein
MLTVVSSALGPLLLAACEERYQSYGPIFYGLAFLCALCAVGVWWVPLPRWDAGRATNVPPASSPAVG